MMNTKCFLSMVCLLLFGVVGATVADSHWTVNPHRFQYDMTVYASIGISVQSNYEVAAFVGDECRGVATLLTAEDGTQVFQLRVRSNVASGEIIMFRAYKKTKKEEVEITTTADFVSQSIVGMPSEPLLLKMAVTKGDVDGDGSITAQDASLVLQLVAGKISSETDGVIYDAADVDGDSDVTAQDASLILQHVAGKITIGN